MLFKKKISNFLRIFQNSSSTTMGSSYPEIKYNNTEMEQNNQETKSMTSYPDPLQVKNKRDLTLFLKKLNLTGEGVEIGVQLGMYSELILENSDLKRLYSIDPWLNFSENEYKQDSANVCQEQQDHRYLSTVFRMNRFGARSVILRMTSEDASKLFSDSQLDFIFIDGNHNYEYVKQDLELWFPKIKANGLFSGDDYLFTPEGKTPVKNAVDEFVESHNLKLYLTKEKFPRWYLIKPN